MGITNAHCGAQTIATPIQERRPWEVLPSENKRPFGSRVRKLREERGWSQTILAEKMGTNPKNISGLEAGKALPTTDQFFKIAKALGMTMSELTRETWDKIYDPSLA